jgi:hypothetical protein
MWRPSFRTHGSLISGYMIAIVIGIGSICQRFSVNFE